MLLVIYGSVFLILPKLQSDLNANEFLIIRIEIAYSFTNDLVNGMEDYFQIYKVQFLILLHI